MPTNKHTRQNSVGPGSTALFGVSVMRFLGQTGEEEEATPKAKTKDQNKHRRRQRPSGAAIPSMVVRGVAASTSAFTNIVVPEAPAV